VKEDAQSPHSRREASGTQIGFQQDDAFVDDAIVSSIYRDNTMIRYYAPQ